MVWRIELIRFGLLVSFLLVVLRLFSLMIVQHNHYQVLAQRQHFFEREITSNRGAIYSIDGYPLVLNTPGYLLFCVPQEIEDKESFNQNLGIVIMELLEQKESIEVTQQNEDEQEELEINFPIDLLKLKLDLDAVTDFDVDQFQETLDKKIESLIANDANLYVPLISKLTHKELEHVLKLEMPGVHYHTHFQRIYPEGDLAANVLGFVGKNDSGFDQGYFGIEGHYHGYLVGQKGYAIGEADVEGKIIPFGQNKQSAPAHGRNLQLTISRELQFLLENKLKLGIDRYQAKSGAGVIIDPNSGAIWALASAPSYHPMVWTEALQGETDVSRVDVFRNRVISQNYEPGSVIKPFTVAMALDEGLITPNSQYTDTGPVEYSGYQVRTWDDKYHQEISVTQILQLSNNTGAAWVGHQVGFDKFESYLGKFMFGQVLGIDLQGEESGIIRARSEWRDIDLANMSFGQGISVTPLQLAAGFAALVNGGVLYQPYVVNSIADEIIDGEVEFSNQKVSNRIAQPISRDTSDQIRYMLRKVVTEGEFSWFVKHSGMDKYSIGGKTGTAQIPVHGTYDPNKTNTTFVGFGPIEEPKFVMLMMLSEPSTSSYSAETVVPIWMETARELVQILEIPPLVE